jgi:putative ABC transport system permease protein
VVKDFHFQSLHAPLAPIVLGFRKNPVQELGYFTLKLAPGNVEGTLAKVKSVLQGIDQDFFLEYHFLDKQWELLYRDDKIGQYIFLAAALLAIFIAALGLLGLTIYAAEQRVKEIGIRKVMGASVSGIVLMLSKDFLSLVLIASIIAIPVAWYFMHRWLQDFAYRVSIDWRVFVLSAVVAGVIAMTTICVQVLKAAMANPMKTLRTE